MEWLLFAFLAMIFWTVVNLMDKHIIDKELRDPALVTTVFGLGLSTLLIIFAFFNGAIIIPAEMIFFSILAGTFYSGAMWFYYQVMQKEDVSRFVPVLATEPMFIAAIAFFVFVEKLSLIQYLSVALIFLGAVLISHQAGRKKSVERKLNFLAIASVLLFVFRNLIVEYTTLSVDVFSTLFWMGIGGLIVPLVLIIFHHPHLRKKAKLGVKHLLMNSVLSGFAIIFFSKAVAIGQVSVISALVATKPLLVFLATLFISKFHPAFLSEINTSRDIVKKSMATVLIVAGGILLVLFN